MWVAGLGKEPAAWRRPTAAGFEKKGEIAMEKGSTVPLDRHFAQARVMAEPEPAL